MANVKRGNEIPTIDVALVTITGKDGIEMGLKTASKLGVNPVTETTDAVRLVVKGKLIAQKPETTTLVGNTLVLTDNVFIPELVKILQGGTIKYWGEEDHTSEVDEDQGFGVARYTPPLAGSDDKGEVFITKAYSAIYNAAGLIEGYECIEYPNCQGVPISMSSEDNVFRAPEYTINSAPDKGEAPYEITYPKELPVLPEVGA